MKRTCRDLGVGFRTNSLEEEVTVPENKNKWDLSMRTLEKEQYSRQREQQSWQRPQGTKNLGLLRI